MKNLIISLTTLAALTLSAFTPATMAVIVNFDDGASHTFNDNTYQNDNVRLDEFIANNPGTHADLVAGGLVDVLVAYNNSTIDITGGSVGNSLFPFGNSTVTISGGSVAGSHAFGNAVVTMSGGTITGHNIARGNSVVTMSGGSAYGLNAHDNSSVTMSGGSVYRIDAHSNSTLIMSGGSIGDVFRTFTNGTIYLVGTDFEVTDLDNITTSLSDGDKLSDFGSDISNWNQGTITGTLADGSSLDNTFRIFNTGSYEGTGDIIIILVNQVEEVEIDIKPGSYPNSINLGSHGLIPVAIISSTEFDATTVDPETVQLAGADVSVRGKSNKYMASQEDVNGDGLTDLILHVATENLLPDAFQDGYAILTGETFDGHGIEGADEINIVPLQ